jgi:hypothetical protein
MVRYLRWIYAGLFWVISAALVVQFFLAGWGVFAFAGIPPFDPHRALGDLIGIAILLGIPLAFAARVPWRTTGINFGLFVLMFIQGTLAFAPQRGIAALHVVNAVLIFGVTLLLTREATTIARSARAPAPTQAPLAADVTRSS